MKFKIGQKVYDKHFKRHGKILGVINCTSDCSVSHPLIVQFKRLNRNSMFIKLYNHNGDCLHLEKKGTLIISLFGPIKKLLEL